MTTTSASQANEHVSNQANTGSGASIAGHVDTGGGDFAGRDINYHTTYVTNRNTLILVDNVAEAVRMQAHQQ